jgi:hypothetical protein
MRKKLLLLVIVILTIYTVIDPADAITSAADGLILWYERLLPTLLPFAVLSYILIGSNYIYYISRPLKPLCRIIGINENALFTYIAGSLFGFPMGSKICADLLSRNEISYEEAKILCYTSNNMSPVFISGYILYQELGLNNVTFITFIIIYMIPFIYAILMLRKQPLKYPTKKPTSGSQINFKIIDAGIMNGFETLTKIGGYIMIFSMISSLICIIPISEISRAVLVGFIEITNGIHYIADSGLPKITIYALSITCTSFGGLSGIAQTNSMLSGTALSMSDYVKGKVIISILTGIAALIISACLM